MNKTSKSPASVSKGLRSTPDDAGLLVEEEDPSSAEASVSVIDDDDYLEQLMAGSVQTKNSETRRRIQASMEKAENWQIQQANEESGPTSLGSNDMFIETKIEIEPTEMPIRDEIKKAEPESENVLEKSTLTSVTSKYDGIINLRKQRQRQQKHADYLPLGSAAIANIEKSKAEQSPTAGVKKPDEEAITLADIQPEKPKSMFRKKIGFKLKNDCFFRNGQTIVDLILPYPLKLGKSIDATSHAYRDRFCTKLRALGLELEVESVENSVDGKTCFIKIHGPYEMLALTADQIGMKKAIAKNDIDEDSESKDKTKGCCQKKAKKKGGSSDLRNSQDDMLYTRFMKKYEDCFLGASDKDTFFTTAERIYLVNYIIEHTVIKKIRKKKGKSSSSDDDTDDVISFSSLKEKQVFNDCFPLHDCDLDDRSLNKLKPKEMPNRKWLQNNWASVSSIFKEQPLNQIYGYFGSEIALYFAWLGCYSQLLLIPGIVGFLCTIYGVFVSWSFRHKSLFCIPAADNITVCRKCPRPSCPYVQLSAYCDVARLTAVFDNYSTFFFSVLISIWAVTFLEMWKRKQAHLTSLWGISQGAKASDTIRPDFEFKVKARRINPVTRKPEPYLPFKDQCRRLAFSICIIGCLVLALIGFLAGVIAYQIMGGRILYKLNNPLIDKIGPGIVASFTGALINLIFIALMSRIYPSIALWLTDYEQHKTQRRYETSYMYKVVIFQCLNFYGTLFYLAFIRGKIQVPPHKVTLLHNNCLPTGCMIDITMQLFVVLIVKQVFQNIIEMSVPPLTRKLKKLGKKKAEKLTGEDMKQWDKDYLLAELPKPMAFDDYLELIIQYGFIIMFSPAFPPAAFLGLLNNVVEIRIDARKYLLEFRRPIPMRVATIGAWQDILETLTRMSVVVNACIIAFTSRAVRSLSYKVTSAHRETFAAYLFSKFDPADYALAFPNNTEKVWELQHRGNETIHECVYVGKFHGPNSEDAYQALPEQATLLLYQLIFVLLFEHLVFSIQSLVQVYVPDVPENVRTKMLREQHLANKLFVEFDVRKTELSLTVPQPRKGIINLKSRSRQVQLPDQQNDIAMTDLESSTQETLGTADIEVAIQHVSAAREARNRKQQYRTELVKKRPIYFFFITALKNFQVWRQSLIRQFRIFRLS